LASCDWRNSRAWLVASNVGAIAIAGRAGRTRWGFLRNWAGGQLLILLLWVPLLTALTLVSEGGVGAVTGWAPGGRAATIWSIIAPVYLLRISNFITLDLAPASLPALALAIAAMAAIGAWQLRRRPVVLVVLGLAAFFLPLGLVLLSWLVPVLVPRYFAWSAGPFFVLVGAGVGQLRASHFAALTAILAAAGLANLSPYYDYETKPRWDQLATRLAAKARPGDVVLVNDYYSYYVFSIFAARAALADHGVKVRWELSEEARLTAERDQREKSWVAAVQGFSAAARLAAGHDLWVIYGRSGQAPMEPSEAYHRSLADLGRPLSEFSVGRYIAGWRYRGPEETDPNTQAATPQACSQPCGSEALHP
jgi:hypothetical protein